MPKKEQKTPDLNEKYYMLEYFLTIQEVLKQEQKDIEEDNKIFDKYAPRNNESDDEEQDSDKEKYNYPVGSYENNVYKRDFYESQYMGVMGGIELHTQKSLQKSSLAPYLYEVTLPIENPEFKIQYVDKEIRTNIVTVVKVHNICDKETLELFNLKVNTQLVCLIANYDRIDTLQYLKDTDNLCCNSANVIVFHCCKQKTLDWVGKTLEFDNTDDETIFSACYLAFKKCDLLKLRWLVKNECEIPQNDLDEIISTGRIDILDFLKEIGYEFRFLRKYVDIALKTSDQNVINWLKTNESLFESKHECSFNDAISKYVNGVDYDFSLDRTPKIVPYKFLVWIKDNNIVLSDKAVIRLLINIGLLGDEQYLNWLSDNNYVFDTKSVDTSVKNATKTGNVKVLNWFFAHGCEFKKIDDLIMIAVENGKPESLEWLYINFTEMFDKKVNSNGRIFTFLEEMLSASVKGGHVNVFEWLNNKKMLVTKKIPKFSLFGVFTIALSEGRINVLDWICENSVMEFSLDKYKIDRYFKPSGKNFSKSLDWLKAKEFTISKNTIQTIIDSVYISRLKQNSITLKWLKVNMFKSEDIPEIVKNTKSYNKPELLNWFKTNYPEHIQLIDELLKSDKETNRRMIN
jgi:hypothetical protein